MVSIAPKFNENILTKSDSLFLRGIAILMVIVAHLSQHLIDTNLLNNHNLCFIISLTSKLGRYGVGIFFFVSGYGLNASNKKLDYHFLIKRLVNVYFPFLIIQFFFYFFLEFHYTRKELFYYFIGLKTWFIFVILVFYLAFFIIGKINYHKTFLLLLFTITFSTSLYLLKFPETWYTSNFAFFFGMLFFQYRESILNFLKSKYRINLIISLIIFCLSAIIYATTTGILSTITKILTTEFWLILVIVLMLKISFNIKLIELLGELSLYLYLTHIYIFYYIFMSSPSFFKYILGIVVSILFSVIIKKLIKLIEIFVSYVNKSIF